ncbi:MAG: sigma-70 family RNA polymerase sigma factor [Planctomycetaceae bacterium]|nr:sigma-70 family RNA polymerase sigma factor [Planctomycetaceae bacterium]
MTDTEHSDSAALVAAWLKDETGFEKVFNRYRRRLKQMIHLRLDRRLSGRIDADDVLQESFLDAFRKLEDYRARSAELPVFLWLRLIVAEKLIELHRVHLGTQKRNAALEVSIYRGPMPEASSAALAAHLMGSMTSPSNAAVRAETKLKIQDALNRMGELDREVLTLRHFELLSNSETAGVLGISQQAASNRYIKALKRMKTLMTLIQEGQD